MEPPYGPPIRGPLPDVADHVLQAERVGGELVDGVRRRVAVLGVILLGKPARPDVGPRLARLRHPLVAPGEEAVLLPGAAGELPFRLGGESLAGPLAVGHGVVPGHVHCRVAQPTVRWWVGGARDCDFMSAIYRVAIPIMHPGLNT